MMNVCSAKPNVSPAASSFEKPSSARERDAHPARDEEHEDEQQRGRADEPELLGDRGVDEVRVEEGDDRIRRTVVVNVPWPRPVPPKPPLPIE